MNPTADESLVDVIIFVAGDKKIELIKAVRQLTGLGLKEAKDLVDNTPILFKQGISSTEAASVVKTLEEAGAKVEIQAFDKTRKLNSRIGSDSANKSIDSVALPEGNTFDVVLIAAGDKKIELIKTVRDLTGLGLKEAKDMVEAAPVLFKRQLDKQNASNAKARLEQAGAKAEIQPFDETGKINSLTLAHSAKGASDIHRSPLVSAPERPPAVRLFAFAMIGSGVALLIAYGLKVLHLLP